MDAAKEKTDARHAGEVSEAPGEECEPLCPQFHPRRSARFYPVQGACVLSGWPDWSMVPSSREYREYCASPRFGQCCWFSGVTCQARDPSKGALSGGAADGETWRRPEVRSRTRPRMD